ncbi:hypothetical protein K1719_009673 [Acacia pycnantha]|nr:hypothetical protein K1719_009673 [Acacia pycnantha]
MRRRHGFEPSKTEGERMRWRRGKVESVEDETERGARGIRATTAKLFVENGAHVVIADVLDDMGTLAESVGGWYIHCDASKEEEVESTMRWKRRVADGREEREKKIKEWDPQHMPAGE